MKACKPKLITCYGGWNIKSELGRKGFKVEGKNLVRKGIRYHMPRSIERALKKGEEFAGNFKLVEEGTACLTKKDESTINSLRKFFSKSPKTKTLNEVVNKGGTLLNLCPEPGTKGKPTNKFILTDNAISFFSGGKTYQSSKANPMFGEILSHLKVGNVAEAIKLTNIASAIDEASQGIIKNDGGVLKHNGEEVHPTAQDWILQNLHKGKSFVQPIVNFLARCSLNPEQESIKQLWRFLRVHHLIILPDGRFIAYKYVNDNFTDKHTGKVDWSIGQSPFMDRDSCEKSQDVACGPSLHGGTLSYVSGESTILEIVVDPQHVVSVPLDSNSEKLRCHRAESWKILKHRGTEVSPPTKQEDFFLLDSLSRN